MARTNQNRQRSIAQRATRKAAHAFWRTMYAMSGPGPFLAVAHPYLLSPALRLSPRLRTRLPARMVRRDRPRRVLHVTCSFDLGGTQRQIVNLVENGQTPQLLHEAIEAFPEDNFLYRRDVALDVSRYRRGGPVGRIFGELVTDYSMRSNQLFQVYKLMRDFEAMRPDVVVGWGHEIAMLTFAAAALARVPRILFCIRTFNPSFGWTGIGDLLEQTHRRMLPHVSDVVVNSSPLREDYARWAGIDSQEIQVCPNGVALPPPDADQEHRRETRARIRAELGIPAEAVVLINVGRFSREKGQALLVDAYAEARRQRPEVDLRCILCGDGPTLPQVQARIRERAVDGIEFPGRSNAVSDFLAAADIFVMPSDFEGMPNAMMEAMAMGLPSISTTRSGAVDLAEEGEQALFFAPGDRSSCTRLILQLLDDAEERQRIGDAARVRMTDFSTQRMAERFNAIIEKALAGSTDPRRSG